MAYKVQKHTQGIAIVSVLIIVAIIAIVSTKMTTNNQRFVHSTTNMLGYQQRVLFAFSVEAWAINLLIEDLEKNSNDSLKDKWANELNDSQVGNYTLSGEILDRQAKININNLKNNKDIKFIAQISNLFKQLDIPVQLIDTIIDYIDNDNIKYSDNGAENNYYTRLENPYKIANNTITDISELMLIKGFDSKIIATLRPYIWAGPESINKINVNTASGKILKSLHLEIDTDYIILQRRETSFSSIDGFINLVNEDIREKIDKNLITVSSNYFLLQSTIDGPDNSIQMTSHMIRDNNNILITRRIIK